MHKQLLFVLLFSALFINAQDSLHVKLNPKSNFDQLVMYKLKGAQQQYVANSKSEEGVFKMKFPENSEPGMYRLFFDVQNQGYFDVLYNNETISVEFDPLNPFASAVVYESKENKIYMSYQQEFYKIQAKLDSLQLIYFDSTEKDMVGEAYQSEVVKMDEMQHSYEELSTELLAHNYVESGKIYFADSIIKTPEEFAIQTKIHFFDYIDFGNEELRNSSVFVEKASEYLFYLNEAEDEDVDMVLKKNAIDELSFKVGENYGVKSEILSTFLYMLAGQQNIELIDYIVKEHYNKLPLENQTPGFIDYINNMLKVAVGMKAPEILWKENGDQKHLSELKDSEVYVIAFWSTTCSHCLEEIPKLYEFIDQFEGLQVIAVALEENRTDFDKSIVSMPNWIHVYGEGKWQNEFAKSYDVNSTPSYFVLDKDKNILAKPEQLDDLKAIFSEE